MTSTLLNAVSPTLAAYYAILAVVNLIAVGYCLRRRAFVGAFAWLVVTAGFTFLAVRAFQYHPLELPTSIKHAIDAALCPASVMIGSAVVLLVLYLGRAWFVRRSVAWSLMNLVALWFGASLADPHFSQTVAEPDNLPIVAMVFLLGFFTWLATAQAVENDRRWAIGQPPREEAYQDKVMVWPHVIYLELIGLAVATTVLIVWSLLVAAPLQGPADPSHTPNPSKAPWYFVGLQELLVYFDPWFSGVTLPLLAVVGLLAVPYLDPNPEGNGHYTIRRRRFAYVVFQFGFLELWILLILIGTFFRGPNWSFFGLYEPRSPDVVAVLNNVKLSDWFWIDLLGRQPPIVPPEAGFWRELGTIALRESLGLVLLVLYYLGLPILLAKTCLRNIRAQLGRARYAIVVFLLLTMMLIPIKMILHWTCHLSYFLSLPEYYLNL